MELFVALHSVMFSIHSSLPSMTSVLFFYNTRKAPGLQGQLVIVQDHLLEERESLEGEEWKGKDKASHGRGLSFPQAIERDICAC